MSRIRVTQRRSSAAAIATAIGLTGLLLGACGSSSHSSGSTTTTGSSATSPTTGGSASQSNSPIVVGNIGNLSNTQLGAAPDDGATPKAWVDWVNANGGINGHPVKLIQFDDKGDIATAVADAHSLVADHVVAIVGNSDIGPEVAYAPYLQQNNIPMIGGDDYDTIWETNADLFPTMATVSVKGYADIYAAKYGGATAMVGAYCTELAACLQDVQAQKAAAPQLGVKYTIGPTAGFTLPDYTAQCLVMANTGSQAYYFSSGVSGIEQMATDCQRQGFKGFWVLPQPDNTQLANAAIAKFSLGQDLQLSYWANVPGTQVFRAGMAKYAAGVPIQIDSLRIWAAFDVFKQALENVPTEAVTPQAVKDGLYKLQGFTDDGVVPPLTYTPNKPTVIKCFELWEIKDGAFVLPKGDQFVCAP